MKGIKNFISESTSSKTLLSNVESNYDVDKLADKINDDLNGVKVTLLKVIMMLIN